MSIELQLIESIRKKLIIEINYKGMGARLVYPHALYNHPTTNNVLLDAYQIAGYSSKNHIPPFWRPFNINHITQLVLTNETFQVAPGYDRNSNRYIHTIEKI